MQTTIHRDLAAMPEAREAEAIIRNCVHCGFCNATCPTYKLLGDELDSPRGRIYLIRDLLTYNRFSSGAMVHLDRCLSCRACETTCPSGVGYGRLLDLGRELAERKISRPILHRWLLRVLRLVIPYPARFRALLRVGQALKAALPRALAHRIPDRMVTENAAFERGWHRRCVLLLDGCVQAVATPNTNIALARLLDRLGITARFAPEAGCCGALDHHLSERRSAAAHMRRLIDQCLPFVEEGIEAIISTASGCGVHLKEYGVLLQDDAEYSEKAARVAALVRDVSEFLIDEIGELPAAGRAELRVAYHPPCSLQHGQRIVGVVEVLLGRLGLTLTPVGEADLCCGSAGSYSILQPAIAGDLLERKIASLEAGHPALIVTGNVGCQLHLATATATPVLHWVELVDRMLTPASVRTANGAGPSAHAVDWRPAGR